MSEQTKPGLPGLTEFTEYLELNYPPDTIILDPKWHAPRIFRAAQHAIAYAAAAGPPREPTQAMYDAMLCATGGFREAWRAGWDAAPPVTPDKVSGERNQCDGCCEGLPVNEQGNHCLRSTGLPVMACEAWKYDAAPPAASAEWPPEFADERERLYSDLQWYGQHFGPRVPASAAPEGIPCVIEGCGGFSLMPVNPFCSLHASEQQEAQRVADAAAQSKGYAASAVAEERMDKATRGKVLVTEVLASNPAASACTCTRWLNSRTCPIHGTEPPAASADQRPGVGAVAIQPIAGGGDALPTSGHPAASAAPKAERWRHYKGGIYQLMPDGYWTPWHVADEALRESLAENARLDHDRFKWEERAGEYMEERDKLRRDANESNRILGDACETAESRLALAVGLLRDLLTAKDLREQAESARQQGLSETFHKLMDKYHDNQEPWSAVRTFLAPAKTGGGNERQ